MADVESEWTINTIVSGLQDVVDAVADTAHDIAGRAETRLAAHRRTGRAKVTVTRGKTDSFVNLDDPDNAMAIEFGHDDRSGNHVGGLYIITGAAGLLD